MIRGGLCVSDTSSLGRALSIHLFVERKNDDSTAAVCSINQYGTPTFVGAFVSTDINEYERITIVIFLLFFFTFYISLFIIPRKKGQNELPLAPDLRQSPH